MTRERIIETADRLDFSASHLATALASGQSRTVGIVLPTLRSWYFSEFASGASEILSPAGFRVELINLDVDSDFLEMDSPQFRKLFRELGAGRGRDALLFAGTISVERSEDSTDSARVPVSASGSPLTSVPGIFVDNRAGGRLIAEHLLSLGHRVMAIFDGRMSGKRDDRVWEQRTDGLRRRSARRRPRHRYPECDSTRRLPRRGRSSVRWSKFSQAAGHFRRRSSATPTRWRSAPWPRFAPPDSAVPTTSPLRLRRSPMSRWLGLTTVSQHAHEQGVRAAHAMITAVSGNGNGSEKERPADIKVELLVRDTTGRVPDPS